MNQSKQKADALAKAVRIYLSEDAVTGADEVVWQALADYEASGPEEPTREDAWNKKTKWERLADLVGSGEATRLTAEARAQHAPTEPAKPAEAEGISDVDAFSRWNDCATDDDGTMEAFYAGIAYARAKPALRQKKDTKTSCNDTK